MGNNLTTVVFETVFGDSCFFMIIFKFCCFRLTLKFDHKKRKIDSSQPQRFQTILHQILKYVNWQQVSELGVGVR